VQASLRALQVLLERVAPSASPLLQRLDASQPTHARVSTLLDFLAQPTPPQCAPSLLLLASLCRVLQCRRARAAPALMKCVLACLRR
jgi:hypothetical protein